MRNDGMMSDGKTGAFGGKSHRISMIVMNILKRGPCHI